MKRVRFLRRKFYLYLLKELVLLFFLSLAVFTFILVMSRLGKMADLVINKGVDLKDIVMLVAYSCPPFLTFTLPMAFLLSAVVVLGRLSSENEILALKASGVNLMYLFVPIAALGARRLLRRVPEQQPPPQQEQRRLPQHACEYREERHFHRGQGGDIQRLHTRGSHLYRQGGRPEQDLSGIIISDDRDEGVRQTVTAETGYVNVDTDTLDLSFKLKNGSLQRWEKQADAYRSLSFKDYTFSLNLASILPNRECRKRPYEMDINELRKAFSAAKGEDRYEFSLEIYKKLSVPFSIFAFVLLTLPLGIKRKTEGRLSGVVYSLLIFICYYILSAIMENIGKVYEASPLLVCFAPNIIFSAAGIYLVDPVEQRGQRKGVRQTERPMGAPVCAG